MFPLNPLTSTDSRRDVSYKRKFVHEVLVSHMLRLAQEKAWVGELTVFILWMFMIE